MMSSEVLDPNLVYKPVTLSECLSNSGVKHASHCMLYSTPDSNGISYALLQLRFDGLIGFAGGEVDVEEVTVNDIIEATNRELEEEINYELEGVMERDWICSHLHTNSQYVLHFFAKELSLKDILHLEKTHMKAEHFPSESLGVFHVPIGGSQQNGCKNSEEFLTNFLRQKFAGNAKQQFIETIRKRSLLSEEHIKYIETKDSVSDNSIKNGTEVKAMLRTELGIHYNDETVDVSYGLMTIRNNGLFDFVGTDSIDTKDKNILIQTLNKSLEKDLGSNCMPIVSENDSIDLSFDNDLSHVFYIHLNSSQFTQIEDNFTETDNFNKTSFGIFRIPFQFRGNTTKSNNYVKRFFSGFLNQCFVNNSRNHLKSIFDKYF